MLEAKQVNKLVYDWNELERRGPLMRRKPRFVDETIRDEAIHETHGPRVGQAEDASQLVVGRAGAIADHDQGRGCFTGVVEDVPSGVPESIGDGKPNDTSPNIAKPIAAPTMSAIASRTLTGATLRSSTTTEPTIKPKNKP